MVYNKVDFSNGKIYKITSSQTDYIYIGSTGIPLKTRMGNHKYQHRKGCNNVSSQKILQYADAMIVLMERYPCDTRDELLAREQHHMDLNKDICCMQHLPYQTFK